MDGRALHINVERCQINEDGRFRRPVLGSFMKLSWLGLNHMDPIPAANLSPEGVEERYHTFNRDFVGLF